MPKKHVGIIGAGSSGLVVMKELKNLGHSFHCFETLPHVGGVYVKSYKNTILTTSSLLTAWSDHSDGQETKPKFWTAEEYLQYLQSFTIRHNLLEHISFSCSVQEVKKCSNTGKWLITYLPGRPCRSSERCEEVLEDPSAKPLLARFDAIAVCTGTNTFSSLPYFMGQEVFKGQVIHSEDYNDPNVFADKNVLVVGSGESGSDITNEVSKVAKKCAIAIRGKHGHIIPRIQRDGRVTDLNTNRCRYSNPYIFGDWIGFITQAAKGAMARLQGEALVNRDQNRILRKISELNMKQKTSAFSKFGCKNEGFVTAMVMRGAELYRDSFELDEDRAVFKNGSTFPCDVVLACTGYRNAFPFFDNTHPELSVAGMNPRRNFKQIFAVEYPGEVGFFGFARPAFGSIPPTAEMQARLWAMVLSDEVSLPSVNAMLDQAKMDQQNWERRFGYDATRVKGLVDYQLYCDSLAEIMGVLPPLREIFFTKPRLWIHIMFGPFTVHQYRLQGPHADVTRAEDVILRQPLGDFLESCITAFFLVLAKFLHLMGFKAFKPNNF